MATELFVHKMSEHMQTARIVRWLVREGETVERGQVLMEVETDKAVAELESPASGVLKGIRQGAVDGAEVAVGEIIAFIARADEMVPALSALQAPLGATPSMVAPAPGAEATKDRGVPADTTTDGGIPGALRATPAARRVAKELGVDLSLVQGTGPEGRIREEDVRAFARRTNNG